MREFAGRHVAVCGGTGALGTATIELLLAQGAVCHVPVHDPDELARFPFTDHERVHLTQGVDLAQEDAARGFFAGLPELWASLQLVGGFRAGPLLETSLADLRGQLELNLVTCFLACREAARRFRASGHGGRLVNVAARPALAPTGGLCAYAASKAAVANLTQSLAVELAEHEIWVNAVVPGVLDTPANRAGMPQADAGAWPSVGEVAETVVFLASPRNRATCGALVPVYGRS